MEDPLSVVIDDEQVLKWSDVVRGANDSVVAMQSYILMKMIIYEAAVLEVVSVKWQ